MPEPSALDTGPERHHHALPVEEVVAHLGSHRDRGLDEPVAVDRLARDGANTLPEARGEPLLRRVLLQFHNPLIYVLLAAALTTLLLGEYVDAAVILGVVLVNALVGFVQESKALAALESLRSMVRGEARVVRAGQRRTIASEHLVSGDLVALEPGEKVPADLRVVDATELLVDESSLTGESASIRKADAVLELAARVADRTNMLYAGSLVRAGTGRGLVVATAERTELGGIHRLVGGATVLATPLTSKLARFSSLLTVVIVALAVVAFAVGLLRGESAADDVHRCRRPRRRRHPGGASGRRHDHPGDRRQAHGAPTCRRTPPPGGRDPGQHHRDLHRQDRHPHHQRDDRAARVDPRRRARGHRPGLRPGRGAAPRRRPGGPVHRRRPCGGA